MSSRVLRRLQGKDNFIEQVGGEEDDICDTLENSVGCGGARRKTFSDNPFDVLDGSRSESDSKEEEGEEDDDDVEVIEVVANVPSENSQCKKKKKKKKKSRTAATNHKNEENDLELDDAIFDLMNDENISTHQSSSESTSSNKCDQNSRVSTISIRVKNLNPNNEMKRIFGSRIVDSDTGRRRGRGGRISIKSWILVNPKDTWPSLGKTGLSMRLDKWDGRNDFIYLHSNDYRKIQIQFFHAVDSLNPDNIAAILHSNPYHVDALIQMSDLYKLNDDLQMAAELIERALYGLEAAFHPLFNIAQGNCQLEYRRQINRPLFICLFKHLMFVGQRACYQTALELCKLLLSLDFDTDPLAIVLCMDFYSLRSRNYSWLINAANEWEAKKNLSQLPNFAYSTALAHFLLAESNQTGDFSVADKLLQDALILFPGVLSPLLDKCSIQCDADVSKHPYFTSDAELGQSPSLKRLVLLYVHRTYHEWKNPKILPWLERNVHVVLERVKSGDPFVKECEVKRRERYPDTPRNVLRHIILSDMKEVTATIASEITSPVLSFDPLPPADSLNLYIYCDHERTYPNSPTLSLFFRSLLPNFNANAPRGNRVFINEAPHEEVAGIQAAAEGGAGHAAHAAPAAAPAAIGDTLRYSVTVLMDAIGLMLAHMPMENEGDDEVQDVRDNELPIASNRRENSPLEPTHDTNRTNTERADEQE